ncbi:MAG: tyrosine-protein phosphatase, partial [Actinomycetota bacterium]
MSNGADPRQTRRIGGDRLVPLDGTLNFRDLGGWEVDGGTVAQGRIFRSDRLNELSDDDHRTLAGLGVRTVCDLRYDRELAVSPSRLPNDLRTIRLPVGADLADTDRTIEQRIADGELTDVTELDVAVGYVRMLDDRAELFGRLVALAADPDHHAFVVHCTAGKDRTGLAAMLILGALGADDETIVADYHLTDRYRSARRLAEVEPTLDRIGVDLDRVRPLFTTPEATMVETLRLVADRWGSIPAYL